MSGNWMIKIIALLWFFGARIPHDLPEVFISVVVGPFTSAVECEKYRGQVVEFVKLTGGVVSKCVSKEEL